MKLLLLPLALLLAPPPPAPPRIEMKGYFACWSRLVEATGDALATYARTQRACQSGTVVLACEKRLSKRSEKAVFEITDTVHVRPAGPGRWLTIASCTPAGGRPQLFFVLFKQDARSTKTLRNIRRVWGVTAQHQLVAVPIKTISCLNEDYGAGL